MKIGLVGFSGSGKSTVFHWLTGVAPDPAAAHRGQVGMARLPDPRLEWLAALVKPKKTTPASVEFVDTPGLLPAERKDNPRRLALIREADGLVIVLTGFRGDPVTEWHNFRDELALADLEVVGNRIARLQDVLKKPRPAAEREVHQHELALLQRIRDALEAGESAASVGLSADEEKTVRSFQLLTLKPRLVLLNVDDALIGRQPPDELLLMQPPAIAVPAKLELELLELSEPDREAFMQDLGLEELSRDRVLQQIFTAMGQIVFYTIGPPECRAWCLRRGQTALDAAAQIHTDLAQGFVRAEVVPFDILHEAGSMKDVKAKGLHRIEGKDYVVQDGDVIYILSHR